MLTRIFFSLLLATLCLSVATAALAGRKDKEAQPNTLTKKEKAEGWHLLFDGKTFSGWRGFHREAVPEGAWVIEDGSIKKVPGSKELGLAGGDIITTDQFENFEFTLEWKLTRGGNSGIKYLVQESLPPKGYSGVSFEYQVLDDDGHPDAKMGINGNRTAGSLYDLIPARKDKILRPVGEWNQVRIVKKGTHIEHWLNGMKVLEFEQGSPEFKARIAESKFNQTAGFGEAAKGHFLLQDHGDAAWYRNIKIRALK